MDVLGGRHSACHSAGCGFLHGFQRHQTARKREGAGSQHSEIQPTGKSRQNQARKRRFFSFLSLDDCSEARFPSTACAETSHVDTHTPQLSNWPGLRWPIRKQWLAWKYITWHHFPCSPASPPVLAALELHFPEHH